MNTPTPLRVFVAAIAVAMLVGAVSLYAHGPDTIPPAIGLGIVGFVLLAGVMFEQVRYKPVETTVPTGADPTQERFIDPATGKLVQVYFDTRTGERTYVEVAKG